MSKPQNLHDATGVLVEVPGIGIMLAYGTSVPADGATGYGPGCLFQHTTGSAGSRLFCNDGSKTSADFDAVSVA